MRQAIYRRCRLGHGEDTMEWRPKEWRR